MSRRLQLLSISGAPRQYRVFRKWTSHRVSDGKVKEIVIGTPESASVYNGLITPCTFPAGFSPWKSRVFYRCPENNILQWKSNNNPVVCFHSCCRYQIGIRTEEDAWEPDGMRSEMLFLIQVNKLHGIFFCQPEIAEIAVSLDSRTRSSWFGNYDIEAGACSPGGYPKINSAISHK